MALSEIVFSAHTEISDVAAPRRHSTDSRRIRKASRTGNQKLRWLLSLTVKSGSRFFHHAPLYFMVEASWNGEHEIIINSCEKKLQVIMLHEKRLTWLEKKGKERGFVWIPVPWTLHPNNEQEPSLQTGLGDLCIAHNFQWCWITLMDFQSSQIHCCSFFFTENWCKKHLAIFWGI